MKAVYKRDLRAYFQSPLGYVFIAAFIAVVNLNFFLNNVNYGYSELSYVYSFMLTVMIFTTPILTMRLIAEEYKQKTDQLLLTAPVKVFGIVTGKFFAALTVFGGVLILSLLWPMLVAMRGVLNAAAVIGHMTALLCAASAFIALGLFISSLTANQLIAALSTLGLLLALFLLDGAASGLKAGWWRWLGDAISDISLFRRYELFTRGVFSLSDLMFYISVCVFFLFLSARILERKRWA